MSNKKSPQEIKFEDVKEQRDILLYHAIRVLEACRGIPGKSLFKRLTKLQGAVDFTLKNK